MAISGWILAGAAFGWALIWRRRAIRCLMTAARMLGQRKAASAQAEFHANCAGLLRAELDAKGSGQPPQPGPPPAPGPWAWRGGELGDLRGAEARDVIRARVFRSMRHWGQA